MFCLENLNYEETQETLNACRLKSFFGMLLQSHNLSIQEVKHEDHKCKVSLDSELIRPHFKNNAFVESL